MQELVELWIKWSKEELFRAIKEANQEKYLCQKKDGRN